MWTTIINNEGNVSVSTKEKTETVNIKIPISLLKKIVIEGGQKQQQLSELIIDKIEQSYDNN